MLRSLSPGSSPGSTEEAPASPPNTKDPLASSAAAADTLPGSAKPKALPDYSAYMTLLMPTQAASPVTASPLVASPQSSPEAAKKVAGASHPHTHTCADIGLELPIGRREEIWVQDPDFLLGVKYPHSHYSQTILPMNE